MKVCVKVQSRESCDDASDVSPSHPLNSHVHVPPIRDCGMDLIAKTMLVVDAGVWEIETGIVATGEISASTDGQVASESINPASS